MTMRERNQVACRIAERLWLQGYEARWRHEDWIAAWVVNFEIRRGPHRCREVICHSWLSDRRYVEYAARSIARRIDKKFAALEAT